MIWGEREECNKTVKQSFAQTSTISLHKQGSIEVQSNRNMRTHAATNDIAPGTKVKVSSSSKHAVLDLGSNI